MKKRFTLLAVFVFILIGLTTNVSVTSANNGFEGISNDHISENTNLEPSNRGFSNEDVDWINWYNSLSKDEQLAVNYVPSKFLNDYDEIFVTSTLNDSLKLKEDTKETIAMRSAKMPTGGYEFPYNPKFWNEIKDYANCYAYALNVKSKQWRHKLQPGEVSSRIFKTLSCRDIIDAAKRDMPGFKYKLRRSSYGEKPGYREYKVALVVGSRDYHWYRQDKDGGWSHKRGLTELSYKDASGKYIYDPKECDRDYGSVNYPTFCGYYIITY